jgi:hypothetical protein
MAGASVLAKYLPAARSASMKTSISAWVFQEVEADAGHE